MATVPSSGTVRATPAGPPPERWAEASRDYDLGRCTPLRINVEGEDPIDVAATATWLSAWQRTVLTARQRAAVRAACIQIAKCRLHPSLGAQPSGIDSEGKVLMAAPTPGVTITWQPHWSSPEVPVLMTLTLDA